MSDFSFARSARPRSPATRTRSVAIHAFMLDSEFVRSLPRFADPASRCPALSTSDHDNHRPSSPVRGTVMPVSNTVGGGVAATTGAFADSVAGGVAAAATADAPRSAVTVVMLRPTTTAATITDRVETANDAGVRSR
jgi:hypothetical protein